MAIVHIGIDLAKNVFAVHGVNEAGQAELVRPAVPRAKLHELSRARRASALNDELADDITHIANPIGRDKSTKRVTG